MKQLTLKGNAQNVLDKLSYFPIRKLNTGVVKEALWQIANAAQVEIDDPVEQSIDWNEDVLVKMNFEQDICSVQFKKMWRNLSYLNSSYEDESWIYAEGCDDNMKHLVDTAYLIKHLDFSFENLNQNAPGIYELSEE